MKVPARSTVFLALLALGACEDSTGPEGNVGLSLSVAVAPSTLASTAAMDGIPVARAETYDDGNNVLVLDRVAIVLEEIELEPLDNDDCDNYAEGEPDPCEEFEAGPMVLELPLDGAVDQVVAIDVPPGFYKELEFNVDAAGDDSEDAQFLVDNPDFEDVSIRVEGTWNGEPFVFTSDLDAEQELELNPPLEIAEDSGPVNLTLSLDVGSWFVDESGALIDPNSANENMGNDDVVQSNIEDSFEIYEDDDRDGYDDDDDDD